MWPQLENILGILEINSFTMEPTIYSISIPTDANIVSIYITELLYKGENISVNYKQLTNHLFLLEKE